MTTIELRINLLADLDALTFRDKAVLLCKAEDLGYGYSADDWDTLDEAVFNAIREVFVAPEGPQWLIDQEWAAGGWEVAYTSVQGAS